MRKIYRNTNGNKKTKITTLRLSPDTNNKIEQKAKQLNTSMSSVIESCINNQLRRRSKSDKEKASSLVLIQDEMNQLVSVLQSEQEDIKVIIQNISERMLDLWQY